LKHDYSANQWRSGKTRCRQACAYDLTEAPRTIADPKQALTLDEYCRQKATLKIEAFEGANSSKFLPLRRWIVTSEAAAGMRVLGYSE
jgi:hypothetical protein